MTAGVATGSTVAFGTSTFPMEIKGISFDGIEREALEVTHMGTSGYREYIPGSLANAGTIEVTIHGDHSVTPPILADVETVTFTAGLVGSQTTGATIVGTAFVTAYGISAGDVDTLWEQNVTIMWDGKTGPTPTAGS